MIAFAIEPLAQCWDEVMSLASEHWKETEGYRHGQPFAPSFERYNQYDKLGWFLMFTARDGGRLVGHAGIYITPSMHTQQSIATEDAWFLLPDYRQGRNAIRFYKYVEDECKKRGVVEICMTVKVTNGAGKILEYLGYKEVAKQYSKHLDTGIKAATQPLRQSAEPVRTGAPTGLHKRQLMDPENVRTITASSP